MPEPSTPPRQDRLLREQVHDPYKARKKRPEPAQCPQCGAVWQNGRWNWIPAPADAAAETCQACHRINDSYPAGEVTLTGGFLAAHRDEIVGLARNQEELEKGEHPLNRIMAVEDRGDDGLLITTTDIHLPRRIGEAVHRAYEGDFQFRYDDDGYFVRVSWHRDA